MFSEQHFYHRITRKLVVSFGSLFNDIRLVRYNKAGTSEIERIIVPLIYANKEKYYTRITEDPLLAKEVQITLPRMSFEMSAITYDPLRKISSQINRVAKNDSNGELKTYKAVPYNFSFSLSIYARNAEDGFQIIEQILPYFSPDYTLTIDPIDIATERIDIPVILESVDYDVGEDVGSGESTRVLMWTLSFSAKGYLYGYIDDAKIIRKVTANTYMDNQTNVIGERKVIFSTGSGNYKIGELVYEGRTLLSANSSGFVKAWDNTSNTLIVTDVKGEILKGKFIKGAVTNASWNVSTFGTNDYQLTNLTVTPDPLSANADSAFGFDIAYEEAPNIT
jgi:hypothetical protein